MHLKCTHLNDINNPVNSSVAIYIENGIIIMKDDDTNAILSTIDLLLAEIQK